MPTEPLAGVVRLFLERWNRDRPQTAGRFGDDVCPVRAAAWLASASGVPESTIQNIIDRRYRMTELRIADSIVTVLDMPDAFGDPDDEPAPLLPIYPNPSAPKKARIECCGSATVRRAPVVAAPVAVAVA